MFYGSIKRTIVAILFKEQSWSWTNNSTRSHHLSLIHICLQVTSIYINECCLLNVKGGGGPSYLQSEETNVFKICKCIKVRQTKLVGLTTNETSLKLHVRLSKQTNFYLML